MASASTSCSLRLSNERIKDSRTHLQKLAELIVGQSRVSDDVAHGDRVHRVVPRHRHHSAAVGHHDMLALARDLEADFLQRAHCVQVVDAGQLGHGYTSTSTSRTTLSRLSSATTSRYSRMASVMFVRASCSVLPCE